MTELVDYRGIMQILQGESIAGLSQAKVQQLLNFANNGKGISAAWAKNILTAKGYHFPPLPKPLMSLQEYNQSSFNLDMPAPTSYLVWPNPAKEQVRFTLDEAQSSNLFVMVTDAAGRIVWRSPARTDSADIVWPTGDVRSGIYFYIITGTSGPVQQGRIVITK